VIQNTFGERLRALRQKAGKSLRQLGSEVGVSAVYLSDIETGRRPPPPRARIEALAAALAVPDAELHLAALESAGTVTIDASRVSPKGREVLARLARGERLTDRNWERISSWLRVARVARGDGVARGGG
jgi:transcriptional regulator with XRE-family HTH domain